MANHVWQRVTISSETPVVHKKLKEWYGNIEYNDVRGVVEPIFGENWEYDTDLIGSKWVILEDADFGDDESYLHFVSAWAPAIGFLEELNSAISAVDEDATLEFIGDEESDEFLFAGYGSKNGFHWEEETDVPERPWEEDCEEKGLDYDDEADRFYDEVGEIQMAMLMCCKKYMEKTHQ